MSENGPEETDQEKDAEKVAGAITNIVTGVMALWPFLVKHKVAIVLVGALFGSHAMRSASVQAIKGDLAGAVETLADREHGPPAPAPAPAPEPEPVECVSTETYHSVIAVLSDNHSTTADKLNECRALLDACERTGACEE